MLHIYRITIKIYRLQKFKSHLSLTFYKFLTFVFTFTHRSNYTRTIRPTFETARNLIINNPRPTSSPASITHVLISRIALQIFYSLHPKTLYIYMYVHTYIYIYRWSVGAAKWVSRREQRAAEAEELFQLLRGRRGVSVLRGTTCKTIDNTLVTLLPTGIRRWVAVLPVIMWLLRSWALVQLPPKSVSVGFHRAFKCRSSNRICATISAVP